LLQCYAAKNQKRSESSDWIADNHPWQEFDKIQAVEKSEIDLKVMQFVPKKLYYKIKEVCEIVGVEAHVLRFWETEFSSLTPPKSKSGQRTYRPKDIELLLRIRKLLYTDGYTIAGARKQLSIRRSTEASVEEAVPNSRKQESLDLRDWNQVPEEKYPKLSSTEPYELFSLIPSTATEPEKDLKPHTRSAGSLSAGKQAKGEEFKPIAGKAEQPQKPSSERLKRVQSELENILTLLDRE
jgi:DNA-binding transcriptional MerR regulator